MKVYVEGSQLIVKLNIDSADVSINLIDAVILDWGTDDLGVFSNGTGGTYKDLYTNITDKTGGSYGATKEDVKTALNLLTVSGGAGMELIWLSSGDQEQDIVIVQDTETLIEIINLPFASFNDSKVTYDVANNWIDVSAIDPNAWITIRHSYLGVVGDADVTPSVRLFPDRNDLNTFFSTHGQSSKQKNGKLSSYIVEFFAGDLDVMQIYIETDKNETLSCKSITIKIENPLN